jgi:pimeloyl-ACP methyl ester carboxylesterase
MAACSIKFGPDSADYKEHGRMQRKHLGLVALALATSMAALAGMGQQPGRKNEASQTTRVPAQPPPFPFTVKQATQIEQANALPISKFYDTPKPFPKGKPGHLFRHEEATEYRFPYTPALEPRDLGIKVVRFLYQSKSAKGKDVPASGVILIPYGKPPAAGWPVIVWAHGTSGVARAFAPSLMKDLYYSWEGLLQWVMLGYAVVAPDYAGLGTNVPHQYLAAPAQAQDVIYAVPAARRTVKELGKKWLAIGHSQGAGAVLCVAETQSKLKDPSYLGAIALASVGDLEPVFEHIHQSSGRGYIAFLAYGIKAVYPDFNYSDFLTPQAARLMRLVDKGGWFVTLATFAYQVPAGKMLKPDWKKNKHFQKFRKLSLLGTQPAFGPVLLIHGLKDEAIPTATTNALHERMQKQKWTVEYRKYPGLDHDPLLFGSFRDQVRWVQDRFDGKPVATGKARK